MGQQDGRCNPIRTTYYHRASALAESGFAPLPFAWRDALLPLWIVSNILQVYFAFVFTDEAASAYLPKSFTLFCWLQLTRRIAVLSSHFPLPKIWLTKSPGDLWTIVTCHNNSFISISCRCVLSLKVAKLMKLLINEPYMSFNMMMKWFS